MLDKSYIRAKTGGNQGSRLLSYRYAIAVCARLSGFQNTINFDFSPKVDQNMAKHNKVVWGFVTKGQS